MKTPAQIGPRLELKTTLPAAQGPELIQWLEERMSLDSHAKSDDGAIRLETLYFDSPDRVCYRGRARTALPKHRLRRYDGDSPLFLEEKYRLGNRVWKRRLIIEPDVMSRILEDDETLDEEFGWFRSRFRVLDLCPSLLVTYSRHGFVSDCGARVTVDRRLEAHAVDRTRAFGGMLPANGAAPVTADIILEIKGPTDPTPIMTEIIEHTAFAELPFSKYSRGLEAAGLETSPDIADAS